MQCKSLRAAGWSAFAAAVVLSGCANPQLAESMQTLQSSMQTAVQSISNQVTRTTESSGKTPSVKDTQLAGIFQQHPYDTTVDFKKQFPRVALKVTQSPPQKVRQTLEGVIYLRNNVLPEGCWTVEGTLWRSRNKSEPVAPFYLCSPRDMAYDIPLRDGKDWFSSTPIFAATQETTGTRRTTGPVPPSHPLPQDLKHKKYYGSDFLGSLQGLMMISLLYQMGFDWSVHEDRRVWFTQFDTNTP